MKCLFLSFIFMLSNTNDTYQHVYRLTVEFENMPTRVWDNLDSMGLENSMTLNTYEIDYFESLYAENLSEFNLNDKNKKIGFIGIGSRTKKEYFNDVKYHYNQKVLVQSFLVILNEEQKELSGGYDAVVLYWFKMLIPESKLIKILLKKDQNTTTDKLKFFI